LILPPLLKFGDLDVEVPVMKATGRIAEVDGLRALAVLLVIGYHFDLHIRGGFLGVDLFFAVSGFVITRLLLTQAATTGATGSLLKDFYTRRSWRLLPAFLATLAVTVLAEALFPHRDFSHTVNNAIAGVGGVSNWWVGATAATNEASALAHTWSLSIEEQFYVLFPLSILLLRRWSRTVVVVLSTLMTAASILTLVRMTDSYEGFNRTYFSSLARATPMALGALLAVAYDRGWIDRARSMTTSRTGARVAGGCFVALLVAFSAPVLVLDWNSQWLFEGGFQVVAVLVTGILLATLCLAGTDSPIARVLRCVPVQWIAMRSYSLYLVHFTVVFRFDSFGRIGALVLKLIITFGLTEVLHRCIEQPLRLRSAGRGSGFNLVKAQMVMAIVAVGYLVLLA
jgi:peptidoglycan/LPS O-acetylase OafA/YrhL